jgi:4'-phosphopantetheinyl transferase EntD
MARAGDDALSHLHPDELGLTSGMAPARLREFTAGRTVARRALATLGVAAAPILPAPGARYTLWPEGTVGSISHTRDLCIAAVARRGLIVDGRAVASLGIDVEGAGLLEDALVREICRADELAHLRSMATPPSGWPKLLFVVKEAVYKAWYPVTHIPLEFHQVELTIDPALRRFSASIHATHNINPVSVTGHYINSTSHLIALALLS